MTNALYKTMEDADIPEHLLHTIAKRVHKDYHRGICTYLETMYTPFERIFRENEVAGSLVLEKLREVYPELEIRVDGYYEWLTVVLKLNATKFIVFHEYKEQFAHDHLVAEGEMVDGNMVFGTAIWCLSASCTRKCGARRSSIPAPAPTLPSRASTTSHFSSRTV